MQRCLQLAGSGAGFAAPNPMVGAVLVYKDRVIGEGFHQKSGEAHAERNCINSVSDSDRKLIPGSTLYVSLEPCAHFGKTPPCADLIIEYKIPVVVIGCRDSFAAVNGKGIEKLRNAGINVSTGIMEQACVALNKRFFTFHEKQRPFIILKWAQSRDGKVASLKTGKVVKGEPAENGRLLISNEFTNRLVHKWRTEEAAILVGANTALVDDPALTARLWPGNNPVRLVIDGGLKLPPHLKLFDGSVKTIVFNYTKHAMSSNLMYHKLNRDENVPDQIAAALYLQGIQSVIIEGGPKLLQSFIDKGLWDEARVITNEGMVIGEGLKAPVLGNNVLVEEQKIKSDLVTIYNKGTEENKDNL